MSLRSRVAPFAWMFLFAPIACSSASDPDPDLDTGIAVDSSTIDTFDGGNDAGSDAVVDTFDGSFPDGAADSGYDTALEPVDARDGGETLDGSDAHTDSDAHDTAPSTCVPGTIESQTCGKCGTRSRLCDSTKTWLDYGICSGEIGACVPGGADTVACGRCGTRPRTCDSTCAWVPGACTGEKGCAAGSVEVQTGTCLDSTKSKKRTCSDICEWSDWSDCL